MVGLDIKFHVKIILCMTFEVLKLFMFPVYGF